MPESSLPPPSASPSREVRLWLVAANVLAVVLVVTLAAVAASVSRAALVQRAADAAQNIAGSLQLSIGARIDLIDMTLRTVARHHAERQAVDMAALDRLLQEQQSLLSGLNSLRYADASGRVQLGRGIAAGSTLNIAGRAYFQQARDDADAGLIVSEPLQTLVDNTWVLMLARRLEHADGSFAGVVFADLTANDFERLFAGVNLGSAGAITVRSATLRMVARRTAQGMQTLGLGSDAVSDALRETIARQPVAGTFSARTVVDQIERASAYHRVGDHPLYVLAGLGTQDYLRPWLPELAGIALLALLLCLALAGATVVGYRAWRRGAALEREQLLRQRSEQHAAELHQLLAERSTMLDVLAHEVRQPLHNAAAALQRAKVALAAVADPVAAQRVQRAEVVLSQVLSSIDNTLASASLLGRAGPIARQDTDIDTFLQVAIADMPPTERQRVRIERLTGTRTASMDMGLMRLALRNLLANAFKYGLPGTPVVVTLQDSDDPLALLIDVSNQGPAVPDDLVPHMFERGVRGRHDSGPGGRGLGLYIVQRVMELHGGSAELLRNTPEGITVRLVLVQAPAG